MIAGLVLQFFLYNKNHGAFFKIILVLSLLSLISLIGAVFTGLGYLPTGEFYIFSYPFRKTLTAGLLIFSKTIHIYTLVLIWGLALPQKSFVFFRAASMTGLLIMIIIVFTFFYGRFLSASELAESDGKKYDVGVVLGAAVWSNNKPSPIFRGRILKADELYKSGRIKKIQLTGSNAPGEISEAVAARNLLLEQGIPQRALLMEANTTTTAAQIIFIKNILQKKHRINNIIIITDDFHLKRVMEMCKFYNVNAKGAASGLELNWRKLLYYRLRETMGLLIFWLFAI